MPKIFEGEAIGPALEELLKIPLDQQPAITFVVAPGHTYRGIKLDNRYSKKMSPENPEPMVLACWSAEWGGLQHFQWRKGDTTQFREQELLVTEVRVPKDGE